MTALLAQTPDAVAAEPDLLPVLPALRGLLPGLRRGQVVAVDGVGALATALVAGVSADGGWCAAVGMPDLGVLAAVAMGVDQQRLLLVDEPGAGRRSWQPCSARSTWCCFARPWPRQRYRYDG
jgi:hypothetical protein